MIDWQELQAVAYDSDKGTEDYDLEKLGKDNGVKSESFNLNNTAIL